MIYFRRNLFSHKNTKTHEIKHSNKIILEQAKHLLNKEKCKIIENKYGKITDKVVLYRGKDETIEDIKYLNIEQFLSRLPYNNND